jgi:hypothetical protein
MNPQRILRTGITASAIAHLSALALVLFFSEVHPFGSVTAEPIAVDLVPAAEVAPPPKKQEPVPEPEAKPPDALDLSSSAAAPSQPPAAPPPPAARPKQQAARPAPSPDAQPAAPRPQPPATAPAPAYLPPQPDLSIKYHVMLGLPPELPAEARASKPGDDFDAPASKTADIDSSLVAEFRRHLSSCLKLPPSIAASDPIKIKLRVLMTPERRLAAEPILIEASASAKGPLLMQSAVAALEACQPYPMLPADRYGEWKVLDLSFTPLDFG